METFSALLAICAGNSPVPGEFPSQSPVTRSFDVFFDLRLNKRLSKHSWGWWLRRHRAHYDVTVMNLMYTCPVMSIVGMNGLLIKYIIKTVTESLMDLAITIDEMPTAFAL